MKGEEQQLASAPSGSPWRLGLREQARKSGSATATLTSQDSQSVDSAGHSKRLRTAST